MNREIRLSDHFDYSRLIRFVIPSIIMMVFTSIYGVVDGLFISNYAGKDQFSAINLIMPVLMIFGSFGFMIGTGGSAVVAKTLGEGKKEKANRYFSMMITTVIIGGIILTAAGLAVLRPLTVKLGAEGEMVGYCVTYGRIIICGQTFFMLQNCFQSFLVTAEKPKLGLAVTVAAGCTNMFLDFLLVGVLKLGLVGAASATVASQFIGGAIPLIYFMTKNGSLLKLTKPSGEIGTLLFACGNGSSELMTNISFSVVNMLYNGQLLDKVGEDGLSEYGVLMYVGFVFVSIFIGYSIGSAPIIGYHYGAKNRDELKSILRKSLLIIGVTAILMFAVSELAADGIAGIFLGKYPELCSATARAFRIYSIGYLFCGFCIFGSSFFTALNNGAVSAAISFLRTLLFQILAVSILPAVMGVDGIWLAAAAAEVPSFIVTAIFVLSFRKKYGYM